MTDPQITTLDECMNDKSHIHLGHFDWASVWQASGASAYLFERMTASCGIACVADYSFRNTPPMSLVTAGSPDSAATCGWNSSGSDGRIVLHYDIQVDRHGTPKYQGKKI